VTRAILALVITCATAALLRAEQWPNWRGPSSNGISRETNLPVRWSKTENVAWRLALPALSASTAIVWGDRIFLNVGEGANLSLWSVDRAKGAPIWKKPLGAGNHTEMKHNMSSPSPVTDGRNVWVMTGTGILKAFDFSGAELWTRDIQKDYGRFGFNYGYASSPLLHEASHGNLHPSYKVNYLLGVSALDSGRTDEAVIAFERVLAVMPNHAGAQMDLARAYYATGSFDLAEAPPNLEERSSCADILTAFDASTHRMPFHVPWLRLCFGFSQSHFPNLQFT